MSARIYIEGGGDSKELHTRCREGFRRLLDQCGFSGRMPRLVACGGRDETYDDFAHAHSIAKTGDYVAMLVDSEDTVTDIEKTWDHLKSRGGWACPAGAHDEQVLLMVTCMETWVIVDHQTLCSHFGSKFHDKSLPALTIMESRHRHDIQDDLVRASKKCQNKYAKGKRSFELIGKVSPAVLEAHLPSFKRFREVLDSRLPRP